MTTVSRPVRRAAGVLLVAVPEPNEEPVILLVRRSWTATDGGTWSIPGGFVDRRDQGYLDTALRETREEVGLGLDRADLDNITYHGERHAPSDRKPYYFCTVTAWVRHPERVVSVSLCPDGHEITHAGWMSVQDVVHSQMRLHPGLTQPLLQLVTRVSLGEKPSMPR